MWDVKCVVFKTCMYQVAAFVITDGITLSYVHTTSALHHSHDLCYAHACSNAREM